MYPLKEIRTLLMETKLILLLKEDLAIINGHEVMVQSFCDREPIISDRILLIYYYRLGSLATF